MNRQTWCVIGERCSAGAGGAGAHVDGRTRWGRVRHRADVAAVRGGDTRAWHVTVPTGGEGTTGSLPRQRLGDRRVRQAGPGDPAYDYYPPRAPLLRSNSDSFLVEPYVYCQNVCGPDPPPRSAWGDNAWLEATAASGRCSLRPSGPRLPSDLRRGSPGSPPRFPRAGLAATARRRFRGVTYEITVTRAGSSAAVGLVVDEPVWRGDVPRRRRAANGALDVRLGGQRRAELAVASEHGLDHIRSVPRRAARHCPRRCGRRRRESERLSKRRPGSRP